MAVPKLAATSSAPASGDAPPAGPQPGPAAAPPPPADRFAAPPAAAMGPSTRQNYVAAFESRTAAATLSRNFRALDRNGDGRIARDEIDRAMMDPQIRGDLADAVAAFKADDDYRTPSEKRHAILEPLSAVTGSVGMLVNYEAERRWPSGIDEDDLEALQSDPDLATKNESLDSAMTDARDQRATVNRSFIFATASPRVDAVSQGSIGDCYFASALAGLTAQRPRDVVAMMTYTGKGDVSVTLGNGYKTRVSVPTDAELGYMGTSRSNGLWYTVAEKAYGLYRKDAAWFDSKTLPIDHADGGGQLAQGIEAVTGHSATGYTMLATRASRVRQELSTALAEHRVVTAGTSPLGNSSQLFKSHAYTVLSYDRESDTVVVRNPWGHNGSREGPGVHEDGTVVLSLSEFWSSFFYMAVEDRQARPKLPKLTET